MSMLMKAVGMGRSLANKRMTETVTIGLFQMVTDPATLKPTRTVVTQRYSGPARVKYPASAVTDANQATLVAVQRVEVSIPSGSTQCFEGDEVVVTASTVDPLLVGRVYTVKGSADAGQTTAARYPVEEVS